MAFTNLTYRTADGSNIPGVYFQAFIQNGHLHFATEIKVYKDGKIDCWGLVSFDEFKDKVRQGKVRTRLPNEARISTMASELSFSATDVRGGVEEAEFVKEVADGIEFLNARPTSVDICRDCLREYKASPTAVRMGALRTAYENVPAHKRPYLGGMDAKDLEYRSILGLE